jgi:DNA repair protein RadC
MGRHYDDPLEFLLDGEAESLTEERCTNLTPSARLKKAWKDWNFRCVDAMKQFWAKHPDLVTMSLEDALSDRKFPKGFVGYDIYQTLAGAGVGVWDGDWDHIFVSRKAAGKPAGLNEFTHWLEGLRRAHYDLVSIMHDDVFEQCPEEEEEREVNLFDLNGVVPYPKTQERIFSGLSGLGEVDKRRRIARKKFCASSKQDFAWMRFDTCVEVVDGVNAPSIASSRDIARFLHGAIPFAGRGRESFMVVCMDVKNAPIGVALLGIGGRANAYVDPTVVFQAALLSGAVAFIVAHNHPSNSKQPSEEDFELTKKLVAGAKLCGLTILDHLVLTDDPSVYFSFLDNGVMPR